MSVSVPNFEQEDQQVMDVVNPHSTPEAAASADQIAGQWNEGVAPEDPELMISREVAKIRARNATEKRKQENRKTLLSIISCLIVAVALLLVLVRPQWLVWLVNIGIGTCCTVGGIVLDRYVRRKRGWQQ